MLLWNVFRRLILLLPIGLSLPTAFASVAPLENDFIVIPDQPTLLSSAPYRSQIELNQVQLIHRALFQVDEIERSLSAATLKMREQIQAFNPIKDLQTPSMGIEEDRVLAKGYYLNFQTYIETDEAE